MVREKNINDFNIKMRNEMNENPLFCKRVMVTGCGNDNPALILVGEAPGKDEEKQGKPFVGKAGKNLTEFLNILEIKREDIYITNLVKIRPYKLSKKTGNPVNRPPNRQEIEFFTAYLFEELEILKNQVANASNLDINLSSKTQSIPQLVSQYKILAPLVVTLGNFPLKAIMKDSSIKIGDVNGRLIDMVSFSLFPLYHPASIIYNQSLINTYNQNLKDLKEILKDGNN